MHKRCKSHGLPYQKWAGPANISAPVKRGRCLNWLRDHGHLVGGWHGSVVRLRNDIETPWRLGIAQHARTQFQGHRHFWREATWVPRHSVDIWWGLVLGLVLGLELVGCGEWCVNGLAKEPNGCHLLEVFVCSLLFPCCLFAFFTLW